MALKKAALKGQSLDEMINWDFINYTRQSRTMYAKSRELRALLKQSLNICSGEKVLDVGCGIGTLCKTFSPLLKQGSIIGIDVNQNLIDYAIQHWGRLSNVQLKVGNGYDLLFPDNTFDIVASMGLIENISNPEGVFLEMIRVAKQSGRLVFIHVDMVGFNNTPQEPNFYNFYQALISGMLKIGVDLEMSRLKKLCKEQNLIPQKFETSITYKGKITPELIKIVVGSMSAFYTNQKIYNEAVEFNYQFLKHVGWSREIVEDAFRQSYSVSTQKSYLMSHLGEIYTYSVPIDLYRIDLDKKR